LKIGRKNPSWNAVDNADDTVHADGDGDDSDESGGLRLNRSPDGYLGWVVPHLHTCALRPKQPDPALAFGSGIGIGIGLFLVVFGLQRWV